MSREPCEIASWTITFTTQAEARRFVRWMQLLRAIGIITDLPDKITVEHDGKKKIVLSRTRYAGTRGVVKGLGLDFASDLTADTITDDQLQILRESTLNRRQSARTRALRADCDGALGGDHACRQRCAEVINTGSVP